MDGICQMNWQSKQIIYFHPGVSRMKRFFRLFCCLNREQTANGISISVALFALLFLHLESSPTPAGANVARRITNKSAFVMAASNDSTSTHATLSNSTQGERHTAEIAGTDLTHKIQILEKGLEYLSKTPHYTAQFVKKELVNGELLDEQEIEMKVRHAPFSVYLKWVTGEAGREVLYVEGENDGRMKAHPGGWKARLPAVNLEPTGSLAMAESRHPITKAGLFSLTKMMVDTHREDLTKNNIARFEKLQDQVFDGRHCHAFVVEYKDKQSSENYRKSITLIDKEWSVPVYIKNFGWLNGEAPADPEQHDEATLVEYYSYSNIKFRSNLIALDFDHTNEDYGFKRQ
jgi:Protein of unknown function (DUF1571)